MFDPMMTLLAAKAKAVGLVAGTALVTTALVGGGAVAMTAVSSDSEAGPESAVVAEQAEVTQAEVPQAVETVSATPTVGIGEPEAPKPLPADFTCDESKNHGQNVSAYARSLPKGPGRGEKVSAVAQSDCGKSAEEAEVEGAEVEAAEAPKPAKAAKAEKPAKPAKAEKPAKPAKATADRPAKPAKPAQAEGKGKPAGAGKPEGKGKKD